MTNTMTEDDKNIKSNPVDSDRGRDAAEQFDFLEGMDEEQRYLFKGFMLTAGNLKNNFDVFYDMQMRLRKAVLATDDQALWNDAKKFAEESQVKWMAKEIDKHIRIKIKLLKEDENFQSTRLFENEIDDYNESEKSLLADLFFGIGMVFWNAEKTKMIRKIELAEPFFMTSISIKNNAEAAEALAEVREAKSKLH